MAEAARAGRLEVDVVADLTGFAQDLRRRVHAAAANVTAKIKVEVDDRGLRQRLNTAVDRASVNLRTNVAVGVSGDGLRRRLQSTVDAAAAGLSTDARVDVDSSQVRTSMRRALTGAVPGSGGRGIAVPVEADAGPGGLVGQVVRQAAAAQVAARANPIDIPVRASRLRGRRLIRTGFVAGIITLAQPALAALGQLGAGVTALVSAAAPAVGIVGALPGLISAAGTAALGTVVGFSGFGDALKESAEAAQKHAAGIKLTKAEQQQYNAALEKLSPSARVAVTAVGGLRGAWDKLRGSVQEKLFSGFAKDIQPAAETFLPMLSASLGDAAGQMGNFIGRAARWTQSSIFKADFAKISGTNSKVIGNIVDGLGNLGHATQDFLVASGPFTERISEAAEGWTRWLRAATATGRADGTIDRFLTRAADKARQLGRATIDLGHGFAGVGRAANNSGEALLKGLEYQSKRFNLWANSDVGQKRMQSFFDQSLPAYREMLGLIGDIGKGLARMATDSGLVNLIRQLRTELIPSVGGFLDAIGRGLGPQVISLLSGLARILREVASAGLGIAVVVGILADVAGQAATLLRVIPGLDSALAGLLMVMLSLRLMRGLGNVFSGLATSVRSTATSMTSMGAATQAVTGQTPILARTMNAYRQAAAHAGDSNRVFAGTAAAMRGGMRGLQGSLGGLSSFLGGPWGIALAAAAVGLSLLAGRQRDAAAAAQQHRSNVETLAQALRDSGGAIDSNVRAVTAKMLQDNGMADAGRKVKVSLQDITNAALDQGDGFDQLQTRLRDYAKSTKHLVIQGRSQKWEMTDQGKAAEAFANKLRDQRDVLEEAIQKNREFALTVNGTAAGTTTYDRLKTAVSGLADSTADADSRTKSLKAALDALSGNTADFHDAQTRVNAAVLAVEDALSGTIDKTKGWGSALIGTGGAVNTASRNGQQLNSTLNELRDSAVSAATAAYDMAVKGGKPMTEALAAAREEMTKSRDAAIRMAEGMGIPRAEAEKLANQLGLVPSSVEVLLQTKGMSEASAAFVALQQKVLAIPAGQTIMMDVQDAEATAALQALGVEIREVPGGKKIWISAPSETARASIGALVNDIGTVPAGKNVTVAALVQQAIADLETTRWKLASVPGNKPIIVEALTATARRLLEEVGYKVEEVPGSKQVSVSAPTGGAVSSLNNLQQAIDSIDRYVTVHVSYSYDGTNSDGSPHIAGMGRWARGGVVDYFARGGFSREEHVAHIAPAGSYRVFGERETGGEGYVPLSVDKRRRSKAVVEEIVGRFNGAVTWFAGGGFSGLTREQRTPAYALHASSVRTRSASRGAGGGYALVGGDLNLTMTSTPTSPSEALNDTMFELRRIRRGGAHATG